MYGYEAPIEISPEQLLQKVTQEQIFEFVLKENFDWAARYRSPFRGHSRNVGTCRFEQREDGTILFVDFGDLTGRTHRTCFRMVMDKHRCSLTTSIKIICEHFGLPTDKSNYKEAIITEYQKKGNEYEDRVGIGYVPKEFNKFDIQHWSQFLIRPEHLKEDFVFSVQRYTVSSPVKGVKTFTPYKYCYAIDFVDRVKIYQPYQTEFKWITNCDENNIGNIDNLPPTGKRLIIKKSYKDHRVVRNTIPELNVIWFQNEGCVPSMSILKNLTERFEEIVIFFDNDDTGIVAGIKLVEVFNSIKLGCARMVHIPLDIPYKDPSEFIHKEGRLDLLTLLKHILCLG